MSKIRTLKKLKKQLGRKQLGKAISEGKNYNAVQAAAGKAKIEPKVARKFQKEMN